MSTYPRFSAEEFSRLADEATRIADALDSQGPPSVSSSDWRARATALRFRANATEERIARAIIRADKGKPFGASAEELAQAILAALADGGGE